MVAQLWEYTKNYQTVHFKQMNILACQFYLSNKAVIKNKGGEEILAK